ncbi:hypothetical protein D3C85_1205390 [compost metagenome]
MKKAVTNIQKSKKTLLLKGVEKLKIIGFTKVTTQSILSNEIYRLYFNRFLDDETIFRNDFELQAAKELKDLLKLD